MSEEQAIEVEENTMLRVSHASHVVLPNSTMPRRFDEANAEGTAWSYST
jgi:hypothetical protein